jgi:hypothetical protein
LHGGLISSGLFNAAGTNAGGANSHAFMGAFHHSLHATKIGIPAPTRDVVRVTDRISKERLLTANITSQCHDASLQMKGFSIKTRIFIVSESRPCPKRIGVLRADEQE